MFTRLVKYLVIIILSFAVSLIISYAFFKLFYLVMLLTSWAEFANNWKPSSYEKNIYLLKLIPLFLVIVVSPILTFILIQMYLNKAYFIKNLSLLKNLIIVAVPAIVVILMSFRLLLYIFNQPNINPYFESFGYYIEGMKDILRGVVQ